MIINFRILVLCVLFYSCKNQQKSIIILNNSTTNFDSVKIWLNNYNFKLIDFKSNTQRKNKLNEAHIESKHDIGFHFLFFKKDSIIIDDFIFLNDLGYIPLVSKFNVNDSLQIKRISISTSD
jgi:hypothetical protein